MKLSRRNRWIIAISTVFIALLAVFLLLAVDRCDFRMCVWQETMVAVARNQLAVEQQLKAGKAIVPYRFSTHVFPGVAHTNVDSAYVLSNGTVVIAGNTDHAPFFVAFEPVRQGTQIGWRCSGKPVWLFDPAHAGGISDCGARYRKYISAD